MNITQFLAIKLHQGPVFINRGRSSLQDEFREGRLKSVVVPELNRKHFRAIIFYNF